MIFLKGLLIALIFGIPAGSIGVLCVNNSIQKGFVHGFVTGLGSTAADTFYAVIGAFGISVISGFLELHQRIIGSAGGVLIIAFGVMMIVKEIPKQVRDDKVAVRDDKSAGRENKEVAFATIHNAEIVGQSNDVSAQQSAISLLKEFSSSFVIAILNPATVLTFLVAFSSFGINCKTVLQSVLLVLGIFTGTVLWWLVLSFAASRFSQKFTQKGFKILHLVCGVLLIGFGVVCILKVNI